MSKEQEAGHSTLQDCHTDMLCEVNASKEISKN